MRFEFATAQRAFGAGALAEVGPLARSMGRSALLAVGSAVERVQPLLDVLGAHGVSYTLLQVTGEPDLALVHRGVQQAKPSPR